MKFSSGPASFRKMKDGAIDYLRADSVYSEICERSVPARHSKRGPV